MRALSKRIGGEKKEDHTSKRLHAHFPFAFNPISTRRLIVPQHGFFLIERNSHSVISFPDDAAREPQAIIRHDQCEGSCNRNHSDGVWKLDSCASGGKVTYHARVFIAAILSDGWLINSVPRGNPGFDHAFLHAVVRTPLYHVRAGQPRYLKLFDLADVEKFKRRWARGERL